jgi:hypothetical protein
MQLGTNGLESRGGCGEREKVKEWVSGLRVVPPPLLAVPVNSPEIPWVSSLRGRWSYVASHLSRLVMCWSGGHAIKKELQRTP